LSRQAPAIVWFRQDLRLSDNPALAAAVASDRPILALYILDEAGDWRLGGASRWWLHHSLTALAGSLAALGATLTLRRGPARDVLAELVAETGAGAVFWNRVYDPAGIARDTAIKTALESGGVAAASFNGGLLFEPWTVKTGAGGPYKVFTAFWRACLSGPDVPPPLPPPVRIAAAAARSDDLADWSLRPTHPDWAGGLVEAWVPGEAGLQDRLQGFLEGPVADYGEGRDQPAKAGTSRLSPHLHFGEISPRQVWSATQALAGDTSGAAKFLSEIGWREFSHHLLFHLPHMAKANLRPAFDGFPWRRDDRELRAWQTGATGYPIVDAGMRQLWASGWMHNRVRMIAASFLVKDLLADWRVGADWFWDTLVDADLANNSAGWQWVAGSGADAAPYFRVFNPVLQGEKFDPQGDYVRRWVPELARLPPAWIHKPWQAPAAVLSAAGVSLGADYPRPIVDHGQARDRALAAFDAIKGVDGGQTLE
jgi:deoxyribodipyrimidine photo-lyase